MNFDPYDLVMLTAHIAQAIGENDNTLTFSLQDCEELQTMAEMLHEEWQTIDGDAWTAVFAYEVTAPLGDAIGARILATGEGLDELQEFARDMARELIEGCK